MRKEMSRENIIDRFFHEDVTSYSHVYERRKDDDTAIWVRTTLHLSENEAGDVEGIVFSTDYEQEHRKEQIISVLSGTDYETIGTIDVKTHLVTFVSHDEAVREGIPGSDAKTFESGVEELLKRIETEEERAIVAKQFTIDNIVSQLEKNGKYSINYTMGGKYSRRLSYRYLDESKKSIIFTSQDITSLLEERRAHEQELHKMNEEKLDLLGYISHDLRTPLNAILGYSSLLRGSNSYLSEEAVDYLDKIDDAGQTLLGLVEDTLDLRMLETGNAKLHLTPEYCSDVMEKLLATIEPMAKEKNLKFTFDNSQRADVQAMVDAKRLQRILLNLLTNAVKFTPEGGSVLFCVECLWENEGQLEDLFTVKDTGIGMSEEFLQKMFEPFSQEKTRENSQMKGVGLGLPIVMKLTKLLGGRIEAESELGKGTTFRVYFTLDKAKAVEEKNDLKNLPLHNIRVLMCEDNAMNAEIARAVLESKGAEVDTAEDGLEGVKKFEAALTGDYDIILMDLRMPVMDGYEAAIRIRSSFHPDAKEIPILAISADAYDSAVRKAMDSGMNAHLPKPFDPERTISEILRLLNR